MSVRGQQLNIPAFTNKSGAGWSSQKVDVFLSRLAASNHNNGTRSRCIGGFRRNSGQNRLPHREQQQNPLWKVVKSDNELLERPRLRFLTLYTSSYPFVTQGYELPNKSDAQAINQDLGAVVPYSIDMGRIILGDLGQALHIMCKETPNFQGSRESRVTVSFDKKAHQHVKASI
ncbi:hypothetical protein K438DRAFT_1763461 [Mycena galopus ATCC 62051]|nr:hypothetical protein K438DRAFT_1763461 [Mycena galopus ATCC 62051]